MIQKKIQWAVRALVFKAYWLSKTRDMIPRPPYITMSREIETELRNKWIFQIEIRQGIHLCSNLKFEEKAANYTRQRIIHLGCISSCGISITCYYAECIIASSILSIIWQLPKESWKFHPFLIFKLQEKSVNGELWLTGQIQLNNQLRRELQSFFAMFK